MEIQEKEIHKLVNQYVKASEWHAYSDVNDPGMTPSVYNKKSLRQHNLYLKIFHIGRPGVVALHRLLDHESPAVRLETAIYLIPKFTDKCLQIYQDLMQLENPEDDLGIKRVKWSAKHWYNAWNEYHKSIRETDPLWEQYYADDDFSDLQK